MNALIASRLQRADAVARASIAREQLIGMGHTRAEIAELPDSWVVKLADSLTAAVPPSPGEARCPYCGTPGSYIGHMEDIDLYQCHAGCCEVKGSFTP